MELASSTDMDSNVKTGFSKKWSYIAALLAVASHLGWFITAQIVGIAYPAFELNTLRFGTQICLCTAVVSYNKQSIKPKSMCDLFYLTLSSTAYAVNIITAYLGTLYLPAGNLDGVLSSLFIFLNLLASFSARKINVIVTVGAILAISGAVCIVQPTFLFKNSVHDVNPAGCPCATLDSRSQNEQCGLINAHLDNETEADIYGNLAKEYSFVNRTVSYANSSELSPYETYIINSTLLKEDLSRKNNNMFSDFLSDEAYGYMLTVITAILFFICIQINSRYLLPIYHHSVISLWNGVFGALLSVITMVSTEVLYFNTLLMCILFLIIHCIFSSAVMIFCNIAWVHVPPEQYAILETIGLVLLFIAQSTFLRDIHPPHGNLPEFFGAMLIICACLLEPFSMMWSKMLRNRKPKMSDVFPNEHTPLLKEQH